MSKQTENGNGELYTPGHCAICRDSEHGDYGNGVYAKVKHSGYIGGPILVCGDHENSEARAITAVIGAPIVQGIPESAGDER